MILIFGGVTVVLLGVMITLAILLLRSRKKAAPKPERTAGHEAQEFAKLAHELIRTFKRVAAESHDRLTRKASELKALLNEADRGKEELASLLEKLPSRQPQPMPSPIPERPIQAVREPEELEAEPAGNRVREREMLLGSRSSVPATAPPTKKHEEVYRLADEGLELEEIAQRTKIGKGEVGLILNLREKG